MKSAFCPVTRNNSPPARRQHIAKVCCFPIGTRLNSRQSRKLTAPQSRKPVPLTEPEAAPFQKPSPAPCRSRKPAPLFRSRPLPLTGAGNPRPSSEAVPCPLPEPETDRPTKQKARSSNRTGSHPFSEAVPCPLPEPETRAPLREPVVFLLVPPTKPENHLTPRRDNYFFLCDSLIFRAREAGFRRF